MEFLGEITNAHFTEDDLRLLNTIRTCLHGGGGPQVGVVTHLGGVTCLAI